MSNSSEHIPEIVKEHCFPDWIPFFKFYAVPEKFKKGELIFQEDNPVTGMHFLISGHAKVFKRIDEEREYIVRLVKEGKMLGLRGIGNHDNFPVSAAALTDIKALFLPIEKVNLLFKTNPEFSHYLIKEFSAELKNAESHMMYNAHHAVKQRLANALLYNIEIFGFEKNNPNLLTFTLTRRDLAALSATTYETVIRLLNDFEQENIVKIDQKKLHILNVNALHNLIA